MPSGLPDPFHGHPFRVLLALLFLMGAHLALAIVVVPPWQGPDEPAHFLRVRLLHQFPEASPAGPDSRAIEAAIIESMARHRWWEAYATAAPDPLPSDFSDPDLAEHVLRQDDTGPVHPQLGRAWLLLWQTDDLVAQYTLLRWLSAIVSLAMLACAWAGTRLLFGDRMAAMVGLLVALHPQLTVMSTAVNPAAIVNLAGAFVWWQAARLSTSRAWSAVALLPAAAVVAVFAKRAAAPLLPVALFLAVAGAVALTLSVRHDARAACAARALRWSAFPAAVCVMVFTVFVLQAPASWRTAVDETYIQLARSMKETNVPGSGEVGRVMEYWSEVIFTEARRDRPEGYSAQFNETLFRSFWLQAGWLRYPAPASWYAAVQAGIAAASVGILLSLFRRQSGLQATGLAVAGFLLAVQGSATYLTFFQNGWYAQGQYLFPAVTPVMVLLAWGVDHLFARFRIPSVPALAAVLLALATSSWALVLLPAYFIS